MALVVLGAVALYLVVKFAVTPDAPAAASVATAQTMTVSTPQATGEALTLASTQPSSVAPPSTVAQGAASIENVPAPAASAPPVDATAVDATAAVKASDAEAAPPAQVEKVVQVVQQERATPSAKVQQRSGKRSTVASRKATRKSPVENDDAELLAAMLPHLKRHDVAITSPAFERRCGQLTGDAAARCKDTFCNGREGADAACPSPVDR
ncbi:MAG: hypothetical protein KF891_02335 [Rhizobacter sp.]|nr:hypothetical protein [Rhizobacter sp.]